MNYLSSSDLITLFIAFILCVVCLIVYFNVRGYDVKDKKQSKSLFRVGAIKFNRQQQENDYSANFQRE